MSSARQDVATWDETFSAMARTIAKRSKDPVTQVGACIASANNRVLSLGYNGTPRGWRDDSFPWNKVGHPMNSKHLFVVHAERNAVLNYRGSLADFEGATLYVTHGPCNECAKEIAQVGIVRVVYLERAEPKDTYLAAGIIFRAAGITITLTEQI